MPIWNGKGVYDGLRSNTTFIVTSNLVLNLDAGLLSSYSGSGTTWNDISGNAYNGTLVNSPPFDRNNNALVFNGSNQYGTIPYNANFNLNNTDYTLEGWVKFNSFAAQHLISKDTYGSNFDWSIFVENSTTIRLYSNGTATVVTATVPTMNTNQWYHIVITSISGTIRIYLNGTVYVTQAMSTSNASTTTVTLGCAGWNNPNGFVNGYISILRIYRQGLTAAQVTQNYNAILPRYTSLLQTTAGLSLFLDAADTSSYPGTGNTWTNLISGQTNGTLTNGPTFNSDDRSIVLDGTNDFIEFGDAYDFGTDSITINMWVRPGQTAINEYRTLLSKALAAAGDYRFSVSHTSNQLYTLLVGAGNSVVETYFTSSTINSNTWYMFTYVFTRNSTITVYLNGVQQTTTAAPSISGFSAQNFNSANPFRIGAYTAANNTDAISFYQGRIGVVQLYRRALAASEILANYNFLQSRYNPTSGVVTNGLVLYLDAGNSASYSGSGTTWTDLSGNGNNLTAINSPTWNSSGFFSTGATGYFSGAGSASIPTGNASYTMMVWLRLSPWAAVRGIISIGGFGTTNQSNALRTGDSALPGYFIHYWWGNDFSVTNNNANLSAGSWFMVTAQFDGTTRRVWANLTNIGSDTPSGHNVTSSTVQIAKTFSTEYLQGDVAVAQIYNRALSAAEITQNFNALRGRYGI